MSLKYQITSEEFAQLDEAKQALYTQNGENYQLAVEGIPQEDVSGLKSQVATLLAEKKSEQEKRRQAEEQARAEADEKARAEGNYKQLFESSQSTSAEWQQKYQALQQKLEQGNISQAATKLAVDIADGANAEILTEFITRRLKLIDGEVRVTDAAGNLTVSTVEQLKEEFKNDPRWASLVRGSQSSGGGAANPRGGAVKEFKDMNDAERSSLYQTNPAEFKRQVELQRGK